jgi:transposase
MNVNDVLAVLQRWQMDVHQVREHVYRAATPRERERWHALWLLAQGWSQARVADALDRDAHTSGDWVEGFRESGPPSLAFEQTGGSPPPSTQRPTPR